MAIADDVIIRARDMLNDQSEIRWTDTQLLRLATDGQRLIVRIKPHASTETTAVKTQPVALTDVGDVLRVHDQFFQALACYICYKALMDDTDDGSANLAQRHHDYFKETMGVAPI